MRGELTPQTSEGERFVGLAEEHAADFATRAAQHDREGSFPFENFDAMKKSGFMAATAPADLGGLGLTSIHDLGVGLSRLGRGDGSTSIAVNMHLASLWAMNRMRLGDPDGPVGTAVARALSAAAAGDLVVGTFITEAGTIVGYPNTEVVREGGEMLLRGKKVFGTISPIATLFYTDAKTRGDDGEWGLISLFVPRNAPGIEVKNNWDALGMRASGSNDIAYDDVRLRVTNVVNARPHLGWDAQRLENNIAGNVGLIATFLGIAEEATRLVIESATSRRKGPSDALLAERPWMQHLIGEMQVDLETCRSAVDRIGRLCDDFLLLNREHAHEETTELSRQYQAAKIVANRCAINVVDMALTASGGAGYMSAHPLSRLYRDVRAGPFMQPYSPPEAVEYIGRVALGQDPTVQ